MIRWILSAVAVFVTWFGLSADVARAQTLYGLTWGPPCQLITINTATGVGTVVGTVDPALLSVGLAFRGGKLYVRLGGIFKEVNPATGAIVSTINVPGIPGFASEGDIAFRSDGIGFICNADLYSFDFTGPSSNLIIVTPFLDGLAFDASDVLYALPQGGAQLVTVNQVTGISTVVGPTGIVGGPFNLGGLTFDSSGNLYAAVSSTPGGASSLYKLNKATGTATLIGNIGIKGVCGLAAIGAPPPPPPPPPPPGGGSGGTTGVGEGTYGGIGGIGTIDGGFGFGAFTRTTRAPTPSGPGILQGPVSNPSGGCLVFNISSRQTAQTSEPDAGLGLQDWALFSALGVALVAVGVLYARST